MSFIGVTRKGWRQIVRIAGEPWTVSLKMSLITKLTLLAFELTEEVTLDGHQLFEHGLQIFKSLTCALLQLKGYFGVISRPVFAVLTS